MFIINELYSKNPYLLQEFLHLENWAWGCRGMKAKIKLVGGILGGTELSGIEARAEGAVFFQTEVLTETIDEPSPHRAGRQARFLRLHQPGPHCFPYPGIP